MVASTLARGTIRDGVVGMLLKKSDDLRVWPVHEQGKLVYRIELPRTHKFFRVGYREYFLLSLLDGKTTLPQACSVAAAKLGGDAPSTEEANSIARWLLSNKVVRLTDASQAEEVAEFAKPESISLWNRLNPFWMKLPLPNGERWISAVARRFVPLVSMPTLVLSALLVLVGLVLFLSQRSAFLSDGVQLFHPSGWAYLFASFVGLKMVHELGHAVACERQGCRVNQFGVVFVLFAPLAYVDVSSSWRLESRAARIGISFAGMWVEMVIASIAMITWTLTSDLTTQWIAQSVVMTAGLATILFNANVLMRFDGYYMLADAMDVANLADEASTSMRALAKRWLFGMPTPRSGEFTGWRNVAVLVYGVAAMVWRVAVCLALAIASSALFHGLGLVLTVLGIAMWWGRPAWQLIQWMRGLCQTRETTFYRGVVLGSIACAVMVAGVFWMPLPSTVQTPVVTQAVASSIVRARVDGFVEEVYVRDGQDVQAGQPLLRIGNEELLFQIKQLEWDQEKNAIELRMATRAFKDGDVQWRRRRSESLAEQHDQLQSRVDSMLIRAEKAGRISGRTLSQLRQTYVKEGDAILEIMEANGQEWITLISPDHIEEARQRVGQNVRVRAADYQTFETELLRIEPRASDAVSEPALAAVHGGSLATQQDRDAEDGEQLRWTQPYFRAWLSVPEGADTVPNGMRLVADCGTDSRTFAARLRNWIRQQLVAQNAL
ncbi:biotin/lipoyl-binding protein [Neorhodopirellula lusitana]|nr:biotin/lipoyl-binding protein [Neorhodopirellula lusitana]